jgi:hypothetical protein
VAKRYECKKQRRKKEGKEGGIKAAAAGPLQWNKNKKS